MNKKEILETIQEVRKNSKKRKFDQTFDLIINLKDLDLKNPEHNVNAFLSLPYSKGKENKIGAIVGEELISKIKNLCSEVIQEKDLSVLGKDKKKIKKIARNIDFFIAQANIMPKIATSLGRILGPMGKMPNPKAGCIVPPTMPDLKPLINKLKNTVKLQTKNELAIKSSVGKEKNKDEEIVENVLAVYNQIVHSLPQEDQNVRNVFVKLTMGKAFLVGAKKKSKVEEKEVKPVKKIKKKEKLVEKKEKKVKENGKAKV